MLDHRLFFALHYRIFPFWFCRARVYTQSDRKLSLLWLEIWSTAPFNILEKKTRIFNCHTYMTSSDFSIPLSFKLLSLVGVFVVERIMYHRNIFQLQNRWMAFDLASVHSSNLKGFDTGPYLSGIAVSKRAKLITYHLSNYQLFYRL